MNECIGESRKKISELRSSTLEFQNLIIQHRSQEVLELRLLTSELLGKVLGSNIKFVSLGGFGGQFLSLFTKVAEEDVTGDLGPFVRRHFMPGILIQCRALSVRDTFQNERMGYQILKERSEEGISNQREGSTEISAVAASSIKLLIGEHPIPLNQASQ